MKAFSEQRVTTLTEACYVVLNLWQKAVVKAGTTEGEEVAKAIAGMSFEAPEGKVTLRGKDNHTNRHSYIAQVKDGEYEVIMDFGVIQPGEDQRNPVWKKE